MDRLLIVDDDEDYCRIIKKAFKKRFFELQVLEAYDGDTAFNVFVEFRPDVIILDVMLPIGNGWETCRRIRAWEDRQYTANGGAAKSHRTKRTLILMVTAIGPNLNEMTSPLYGADAYIDKPIRASEIIAEVEKLLETR
ncbi:MAG: response regulator transcription factor [Patescibacteria group bacterium]